MTELQIKSSHIKKAKYDAELKVLSVTFQNDMTYDYFNVPVETIDELLKVESAGKFFHANIKNSYKCKKRG